MSSAARTNLTSQRVNVSGNELGQGSFRVAYEGEYVGGNRNQQACACKQFKACFARMEDEFFQDDFRVADKAVQYAEEWNQFCEPAKEIMITVGDVHVVHGDKFLVEPLIREYRKFTSNSGWIEDSNEHAVLAMEAFSHFTYHRSGGNLLVCDLQGRLKKDRFSKKHMKSRFELTDVAICSRQRLYGPTDLGEKGIDSFFSNHVCNQFCHADGTRWQQPSAPEQWFEPSSGTSMFSSNISDKLTLQSRATFKLGLDDILEEDSEDSGGSDSDCPDY
jgi:hypothetical protein